MQRDNGFTLIELLFVVVILGVLSTGGILFYQQQMQNQKIDKTIAQVMQWQQAGMAYYIRNKKWPVDAATLISEGYMPPASQQSNPWCPVSEKPCYRIEPRNVKNEKLFTIIANIPAGFSIREQIAARLPYAEINQDSGEVRSTVNIPLAGMTAPPIIITEVLPLYLDGKKGHFIRTGSGPSAVVETKWGGVKLEGKTVFPCAERYGKSYSFVPHLLITSYKAGPHIIENGKPGHFPVGIFSRFALRVNITENWDPPLSLIGTFRPQIYWSQGWKDPVRSSTDDISLDDIEIKGQILFTCCKEGFSCMPQPSN
ncbi:MAG: type II secretion system protein [Gammaproteobacteria bacterium]